jgi:hypothetical protein
MHWGSVCFAVVFVLIVDDARGGDSVGERSDEFQKNVEDATKALKLVEMLYLASYAVR